MYRLTTIHRSRVFLPALHTMETPRLSTLGSHLMPTFVALQSTRPLIYNATLRHMSTSPSSCTSATTTTAFSQSTSQDITMPKEAKPRKADKEIKSSKAKKDPNAPKRPLSAYMYFSQDMRPSVKDQNPDATFGDLGKLLGRKWREMSDAQKKPYQDKAEKDKTRYEGDKAGYDTK